MIHPERGDNDGKTASTGHWALLPGKATSNFYHTWPRFVCSQLLTLSIMYHPAHVVLRPCLVALLGTINWIKKTTTTSYSSLYPHTATMSPWHSSLFLPFCFLNPKNFARHPIPPEFESFVCSLNWYAHWDRNPSHGSCMISKISMAFAFTFLLLAQLPTRVKIFFTHMRMSTPTLSRPWLTFTEAHLKIMYRKLFLRFLQYYLAIYHAGKRSRTKVHRLWPKLA